MYSIYFKDVNLYLHNNLTFSNELNEDFFKFNKPYTTSEYFTISNYTGQYIVVDDISDEKNCYNLKLSISPDKLSYYFYNNQIRTIINYNFYYLSFSDGKLILTRDGFLNCFVHTCLEFKDYDFHYIKNSSISKSLNYSKTILFIILPLGEYDIQTIQKQKEFYLNITHVDEVKILYNSVSNMLKRIIQLYFNFNYLTQSKFSIFVYDEILNYLKANYKVFVYGNSYGGAIISTVADMFNTNILNNQYEAELFNNLYMATFGSIFTISHHININLVQYMFYNDVALKINKLRLPNFNDKKFKCIKNDFDMMMYDHKQYVTWIKTILDNENVSWTIFGTKREWEFHNFYNILRNNLIHSNTIYIDEIKTDKYILSKFCPDII